MYEEIERKTTTEKTFFWLLGRVSDEPDSPARPEQEVFSRRKEQVDRETRPSISERKKTHLGGKEKHTGVEKGRDEDK